MKLRRHQRGDTIVEVLIAIAIVSTVLAAAYAVSSRNSRISQEVQEQAFAQKLVEEQTETLRASGAAVGASGGCFRGGAYGSGGSYCEVTNGGAVYRLAIDTTAAPVYDISATWTTLTGSNANVNVYYRVE